MEWSIQEIARIAGTTSRTLRHYDDIGLVPPSRVGQNGYRYYDRQALVRLQRVLLLRDLGVGLRQIGEILERRSDEEEALTAHLGLLRQEQNRLTRQIAAVQRTIKGLEASEELVAELMFDGFDHSQYREEVERRWGKQSYARSDAWWRGLSREERKSWQAETEQLNRGWTLAAKSATTGPDGDQAQDLARRHVEWLRAVPGTPAAESESSLRAYVTGLAQMYVDDERFAANYGGAEGAKFVRDALLIFMG